MRVFFMFVVLGKVLFLFGMGVDMVILRSYL